MVTAFITKIIQKTADLEHSQVAASVICGYFFYYFYKVVHRPQLVVGDGEFKNRLNCDLTVLKEHFWPTFWAFSTHFQTIGRVLFKSKPFVAYKREVLDTLDNGQISLDWIANDDDNKKFPNKSTRPTVIILPGITGCSDASYVRHIAKESECIGFRTLVFINRGLGKTSLKTPRTFCASNVEDLEFVLNHVKREYPESPLLFFAVSLGGTLLTNYLSRTTPTNVVCALVLSAPWDSTHTSCSLEQPINRLLYNRFIVNRLKDIIKTNWKIFQDNVTKLPYKLEDVMKARTIREFDDVFTCKSFGYPSHHEYYVDSSLVLRPLEDINVPMLFLNARDDPFSPVEGIPLDAIKNNSNMAIILTDYGGHIGFVEGATIRDRSFVERLFRQYMCSMINMNAKSNFCK